MKCKENQPSYYRGYACGGPAKFSYEREEQDEGVLRHNIHYIQFTQAIS